MRSIGSQCLALESMRATASKSLKNQLLSFRQFQFKIWLHLKSVSQWRPLVHHECLKSDINWFHRVGWLFLVCKRAPLYGWMDGGLFMQQSQRSGFSNTNDRSAWRERKTSLAVLVLSQLKLVQLAAKNQWRSWRATLGGSSPSSLPYLRPALLPAAALWPLPMRKRARQ